MDDRMQIKKKGDEKGEKEAMVVGSARNFKT
jgi:hypothetical protein